jgi:nucleoredoxin
MASWAVELFGQQLLTKDGMKATADVVVNKKAVLVYFSAHWCPPCRGFTPVLADAYTKYRAGDIEVVFVSSDRDEGSFSSYFSEMPWTAVPFANRNQKDQLSQKFNVSGIPKLIVLNGADGKVVSENGRGEVVKTSDLGQSLGLWGLGASTGPSSVDLMRADHWGSDLFGDIILTKSGKKSTVEVLGGKKAVLVYFSAHWCPPCRGFTPLLAEAYKKHSAKDIEIIFVSSDRDQGSFDGYFGEMPWMALPFAEHDQKNKIAAKFDVQGIPMLVVLNGEDGKTISVNGRADVQSQKGDLNACLRLWLKEGNAKTKKSSCCVIS